MLAILLEAQFGPSEYSAHGVIEVVRDTSRELAYGLEWEGGIYCRAVVKIVKSTLRPRFASATWLCERSRRGARKTPQRRRSSHPR
jgi:hypothetical protein